MKPRTVIRLLKLYDEWHEAYIMEKIYGLDDERRAETEGNWLHRRDVLFNHLLKTPGRKETKNERV